MRPPGPPSFGGPAQGAPVQGASAPSAPATPESQRRTSVTGAPLSSPSGQRTGGRQLKVDEQQVHHCGCTPTSTGWLAGCAHVSCCRAIKCVGLHTQPPCILAPRCERRAILQQYVAALTADRCLSTDSACSRRGKAQLREPGCLWLHADLNACPPPTAPGVASSLPEGHACAAAASLLLKSTGPVLPAPACADARTAPQMPRPGAPTAAPAEHWTRVNGKHQPPPPASASFAVCTLLCAALCATWPGSRAPRCAECLSLVDCRAVHVGVHVRDAGKCSPRVVCSKMSPLSQYVSWAAEQRMSAGQGRWQLLAQVHAQHDERGALRGRPAQAERHAPSAAGAAAGHAAAGGRPRAGVRCMGRCLQP